jgi:hypothetical protein
MALVSYSRSRLARCTKDLLTFSDLVAKRRGDLMKLTIASAVIPSRVGCPVQIRSPSHLLGRLGQCAGFIRSFVS